MSDVEWMIDAMREGALAERWRALTPFEQQVGLALWGHDVRGSSVADAPIDAHYLNLARQVAAAINATALACAKQEGLAVPDGIYWNEAAVHDAALEALRGGPPAAPPPP